MNIKYLLVFLFLFIFSCTNMSFAVYNPYDEVVQVGNWVCEVKTTLNDIYCYLHGFNREYQFGGRKAPSLNIIGVSVKLTNKSKKRESVPLFTIIDSNSNEFTMESYSDFNIFCSDRFRGNYKCSIHEDDSVNPSLSISGDLIFEASIDFEYKLKIIDRNTKEYKYIMIKRQLRK